MHAYMQIKPKTQNNLLHIKNKCDPGAQNQCITESVQCTGVLWGTRGLMDRALDV